MKVYKFTEQSTNNSHYTIFIVAENERIAYHKFLQEKLSLDLNQTTLCIKIDIEHGTKWKIEIFNIDKVIIVDEVRS